MFTALVLTSSSRVSGNSPESLSAARTENGGEGWIRTSVRLRGQIYSLLPLTTRPPLHRGLSRSNRPSGWQAWRSGRRAMWRRRSGVSTRVSLKSCRPFTAFRALQNSTIPGWPNFGAGEGNRTLVVSLEGFCSTIELHPLAGRPMPLPQRSRQPISRLTRPKRLPYHANRMTNLVAIAASSTARRWWWRSCTLAARWRD